ncbi:MAG: DUF1573 domain-containing protein [Muribaculaceae bacterium]|nr:DUF1573 domain-containing protein [Muribaculaceae bacterium]
MRHILLTLTLLLASLGAMARGEANFEKQNIDFGTVKADAGTVVMKFPFTNTGDEPIGIVTVTNGGCGCTKPEFPQHPIKPGETGEIVIRFNPATFHGEVNRSVKVQLSSQKKRVKLTFSGVVVPK